MTFLNGGICGRYRFLLSTGGFQCCRAFAAVHFVTLGLLLACSPARAGHWVISYNSTFDSTPSSNHAAPSFNGPASAHTLVVTATLTWTKDSPQDTQSFPATISYIEKAVVGVNVSDTTPNYPKGLINEKDKADDGLQDAQVEAAPPTPPNDGATSAGSHLSQKPGAATVTLDTRTLTESLTYDAGSDAANGGYGINYSVTLVNASLQGYSTLDNANWDPANPRFFSGTDCEVKASGAAANGHIAHMQVDIGGTLVAEYDDTAVTPLTSNQGTAPNKVQYQTGTSQTRCSTRRERAKRATP